MKLADLEAIYRIPADHLKKAGWKETQDGVLVEYEGSKKIYSIKDTGEMSIKSPQKDPPSMYGLEAAAGAKQVWLVPTEIEAEIMRYLGARAVAITLQNSTKVGARLAGELGAQEVFISSAVEGGERFVQALSRSNGAATALEEKGVVVRVAEWSRIGLEGPLSLLISSASREDAQTSVRMVIASIGLSAEWSPSQLAKVDFGVSAEIDVARQIATIAAGQIAHERERDSWYVYHRPTGHWVKDKYAVKRKVMSFLETKHRKVGGTKDAVVSERKATSILRVLPIYPSVSISSDDLDDYPHHLLPVQNGMVDLKTGQLHPASSNNYVTAFAPLSYHPSKSSELWLSHIEKIFPDPDKRRFVQTALGYSLYRYNPQRAFFMATGSGANGKSVTLGVIVRMLGMMGSSIPMEWVKTDQHAKADPIRLKLRYVRFALLSETEKKAKLNTSTLKSVTGMDPIQARGLYEPNTVEFTPSATFWLQSNHLPRVDDDSHAAWDRIRIIRFEQRIPEAEQNDNFLWELLPHANEILTWLVRGAVEYSRLGLPRHKDEDQEYRRSNDTVYDFLDGMNIKPGMEKVPAKEVFDMYKKWALQSETPPVGQRTFYSSLQDKGFAMHRSNFPGRTQIAVYLDKPL